MGKTSVIDQKTASKENSAFAKAEHLHENGTSIKTT